MGSLISIYIAEQSGTSMQSIGEAQLEAGNGVVGDRYHTGKGTFSGQLAGKPHREVTLIESEEIARFNAITGLSIAHADPRRNLVTRGVRLNDLVNQRFRVGEVELEGVKLCEPCSHLAETLTPEVLPHLIGRGGLRARVIRGGQIQCGDEISRQS